MAMMTKEMMEEIMPSLARDYLTALSWTDLLCRFDEIGQRRDTRKAARQIAADVAKLRSCSEAGKQHIIQERCARAGFTVEGEPRFYFGKTGR